MPSSLLHQQALQRLSLLRLASIATWIAFVFYLAFQHAITLSYTGLMVVPYVGLLLVGVWQAWYRQVSSTQLAIHLVLECQLLTVMLFYSGGAANPLISYFFVLLVIATYSLPLKHAIAITALCILDYSLLMVWHKSLISQSISHDKSLFDLHLIRSEEHTSELQSRPHLVC